MTADTRLCALPHFDFDSRACRKVFFVNAESSGRNLDDGVSAVAIKVFVKSALARIITDPEFFGGFG